MDTSYGRKLDIQSLVEEQCGNATDRGLKAKRWDSSQHYRDQDGKGIITTQATRKVD